MAKTAVVSGHENNGSWKVEYRQSTAVAAGAHDGSDLKDVVTEVFTQLGDTAKAAAVRALVVVAAGAGYNAAHRRRWSISGMRGGSWLAEMSTSIPGGEDKFVDDFLRKEFRSPTAAIAWVVGELGHAAFKAQIEAL